jgi:hypothetical protein
MHIIPKSNSIADLTHYSIIPLFSNHSTLNVSILAKNDVHQKTFILLRSTSIAKVYLGCIVDFSNQILDWIEIWIQETQPLFYDADSGQTINTNSSLDQEWLRNVEQLEKLPHFDSIHAGCENTNPLPSFLDRHLNSLSSIKDSQTGEYWQLCSDDILLKNHNLPLYSTSIHRYLYLPSMANNPRFLAVYDFSPKNDSTILLKDCLKDHPNLLPLNPSAGFMLIRKFYPMDIESLIEILSNSTASSVSSKLPIQDLIPVLKTFYIDSHASSSHHRLFCDAGNSFGKTNEIFYLKLQLFTEMISMVYRYVKSSQKPLFNLCPASWQVDIIPAQSYLPLLWTARPVLIDSGNAIYLKIPETDKGYYTSSVNFSDLSIYRPANISLKTRGYASIRIRQLSPETDPYLSLDGTFFSDERILLASNDLVRLRLNLNSEQIECFAVLENDSSLPPGQWRFRTLGQKCGEQQRVLFQSAIGVHLSGIPFQVIPHLNTPCDLYSLAVLGIRIFIVNGTNSLPIAFDELLSMAHSISLKPDLAAPVHKRIEMIFKTDPKWINALGSGHLTTEMISSDSANRIPAALWYELLATLIQMIPGAVQDSICKDYGDTPLAGLHVIFEKPLEQLESLMIRSRSLIVNDWNVNRQISAIIDEFIT